jgi:hypothetical protein
MTSDPYIDLAEEILWFITGLPNTIAPEIYYFVVMHGLDEGPAWEESANLCKITEALTKSGGFKRMSVTVRRWAKDSRES